MRPPSLPRVRVMRNSAEPRTYVSALRGTHSIAWQLSRALLRLARRVAWFGRLGLSSTRVCIVCLSPEYLASVKCRQELLSAAKENKLID